MTHRMELRRDRHLPPGGGFIIGTIIGAAFWSLMWWIAAPAVSGLLHDQVPIGCEGYRAEVVACAEARP